MKIAQISTLIESVPPRFYGGTERVVSYLTEALVAEGHEVTLFASGDSLTGADLEPCLEQAVRLNARISDPLPHYMIMLDRVRARAAEFDVLHFHIDHLHFPTFKPLADRTLTTLHGRQDLPDLKPLYEAFKGMPLVSISNAQRGPIREASFVATIYHGLPSNLFRPTYKPQGGYLAFLGRIAPEKGIISAISIARACGLPLKIAAKVDAVDQAYFQTTIKPLINSSDVIFIGEVDESDKEKFLGEAHALLFPIDWPEPFGLVMIEAMACGTPILAFDRGSVREIIDEGVTGIIIDREDDAPKALARVMAIDRRKVRRQFEQRFTSKRMAADYMAVYETLSSRRRLSLRTLDPVSTTPTSGAQPHSF